MHLRTVTFATLALVLCGCCMPVHGSTPTIAPSPSAETIARQARHALERTTRADGPGAAVLIAQGDRVLYRDARGLANIELGVPLAPDQVFRIASVTKLFTAATVLALADAGELSLDDPLSAHLPDFPHAGHVTLRQLLNHTAGISDTAHEPQPGFSRREVDTATRIADIRRRPLDFPAGTRWAYSNSGYVLLGAVIEQVTGESWHAAMRSRLFARAGLQHTVHADPSPLIAGRVSGYTRDANHAVVNAPYISMSTPAAAGALASTLDDLHRWMTALAHGRVIGTDGFRQMIEPTPQADAATTAYGYGFGTYLWNVRGAAMIGHTGQINGCAAVLAWLPDADITIVALANDDTFDARTFGRRLAAIALGRPYPDVAAITPSAQVLAGLAGRYGDDPATHRTLSLRDGVLHAQRDGGNAVPLQVTGEGHLHFVPDELSRFVPVRDPGGAVIRLDYYENGDGPPKPLRRIAAPAR